MACLWFVVAAITRQYAIQKLQTIEKQYNLDIRYQSVSLKVYDKLLIEGLTIVPGNSSLLLYAQSFVIKANLWKSSFSREDIEGFEVDQLYISYVQKAKQSAGMTNYASDIERVFEKTAFLSPYLPSYVSIRDIHFSYRNEKDVEQTCHIPQLRIAGNRFVAEMQNTEDSSSPNRWICQGSYQKKTSRVSLQMYAKKQEKITLPFVKDCTGAAIQFDTLIVDLRAKKNNDGVQVIQGKAGVKGLSLYHAKLSSDTLQIGKGLISYRLFVGKNFIEVDSSATTVRYNKLQFNPFVRIEKNRKWKWRVALDKRDFPADHFFTSLPKGVFSNLDGLRVSGTLSWHFLLDVDMAKVHNLLFESVVQPHNFRILKYGNTDLRRMNRSFVHTIYTNGQVVRSFEVGNQNPGFRPIHSISRYLPAAIMHGEDFAFYNHRGFYPEAFHKSLVENIEAGDFLRGASTLSMQVVKNVFLNLDKTIMRKLEEILIVWLIENNHLTSKSRMFEVYMNIIEWGPNVYGITEAARFYFAKDPSTLTLGECIFLAYIIPSPRHIRNHFDGLRLKYPYYEFFHNAVRRLAQRGFISPEDASTANPDIIFRGPVMEYLIQ
jgi:hypothetical protein